MTTPPDYKALGVPDAAVEVAKQTARNLSPICNVCSVAYEDEYRGPCQEPRPPFTDSTRTCPGTVDLTPGRIAERSVAAAYPEIHRAVVAEVSERLASEEVRTPARLAKHRVEMEQQRTLRESLRPGEVVGTIDDRPAWDAFWDALTAALNNQADNQGEAG